MANEANEQSPLLQSSQDENHKKVVEFSKEDEENPRNWSRRRKLVNVVIIASMALLSPLASSMFTPGIKQIAQDLNTDTNVVVGTTTGFVVLLGIGPLILAPLSETFGRRKLYLICFSLFAFLQIPTALSPNIESLITVRTLSGFFGSVGIANGGGTISDMYRPSERAAIFGWYLLGPLLGPTLGPLCGGLLVENLGWRWVFWFLTIICSIDTMFAYFLLKESYAPVILENRKSALENEYNSNDYRIANEDSRPFRTKLASSMQRPLKILFTQPVVFVTAIYQAMLFGTNFTLYTNFQAVYGAQGYGFSTTQVGLMFLGPGIGFVIAIFFIAPRIDTVYNRLTARNDGISKPEFRMPLANLGAVLIPISLFAFAWTVNAHVYWLVTILCTTVYGVGQITIFNTVQNYYIDSFSDYAASAIAAGALFRCLSAGLLPLFAPPLFDQVGYGWGFSVFGFLNLALSPFPILIYYFGEQVRTRYSMAL